MDDVEIISAPNSLRKAKSGSGPAKLDPALLQRAENAVKQMAASYSDWVRDDMGEIEAAMKRLTASQGSDTESVKVLYWLAFDMKGQGGSFGFPLVTEAAGSLATYLSGRKTLDSFGLEVVAAHISAMRAVIGENVRDDGGATGGQLVEGLRRLVEKARAVENPKS